MRRRLSGIFSGVARELPQVGTAGSRSAQLHAEDHGEGLDHRFDFPPSDADETSARRRVSIGHLRTIFILRWMGTVGSLLIALGALGAGALPVVGNPYDNVPLGSTMSRMLQTSSSLVMVGVGLLVVAWVLLAPFVGTPLQAPQKNALLAPVRMPRLVTTNQLWRIYASWVIPLLITAPLFTQDIYSYLAQGSIVRQGLDVYSAGPVQLLGTDDPLARSVPFIWANSPSPYGPVALSIAAAVSLITADSIMWGVFAHRIVSLIGVVAAGWAITRLATRCRVSPETALWLGVLNPLALLHLIGGIHNESILLGLALVGMELGLRALQRLEDSQPWLPLFLCSSALIACAGMVKVTGFIALGFTGMALARALKKHRAFSPSAAIASAIAIQTGVLLAAIAAVTLITGIGLGWVTGQGGAATIRSWLSMSTATGVAAGFVGMFLGLGDHTDAILTVTRTAGVLVAAGFMVRMLFATYRGSIHPVGGWGVSTLLLVILFPVVHPWYILWAVFPLAAWANRFIFRLAVIGYSSAMSFFVLPRGLGLPPSTVAVIYLTAAISFAVVMGIWWVLLRRSGARILN